MNRIKWWAWTVAVLLIIGIGFALKTGSRADRVAYRTIPVRRGNLKATVASTGRLAPVNTVEVGSQVSGNIRKILVDYNAEVKKDQVLALIDASFYAGQVDQARAQLEKARTEQLDAHNAVAIAKCACRGAEAQLFTARATLEDAERIYNRFNALAVRRITPGAERDTALTRRDQAIGGVRVAESQVEITKGRLERALVQEKNASANVAEKQAGLELAKIRLAYCTIKSPIDGVVIHRNVDQGQTVAATLQSPLFFIIAEDLKRMQVEIDVSEADVGRIEAGQTVEFNVDAYPNRTFTAVVHQIRNSATNINNVITYKIIANVSNRQLLLRPGMTANAAILTATVADTLIVPNAALRYKPEHGSTNKAKAREQRRARVYLLRENAPEAVNVVTGITDETETQLIGNDLAEGDRVIVGKAFTSAGNNPPSVSLFSKLKP